MPYLHADQEQPRSPVLIHPTLWGQCWSFMIGSFLFALGAAPGVSEGLGTVGANISFFVGSWFFTAGAFMQLLLSGPYRGQRPGRIGIRAIWLSAAVQLLGTLLFNVSTGSALHDQVGSAERDYVWVPNAEGSVAFLISACLVLIPLLRDGQYWAPRSPGWVSSWLNLLGSAAFGVSAVGANILEDGDLLNSSLATTATFVGALFFFATSAVMLPTARREQSDSD